MHGLNLVTPEQAKAVIKPWSEREDTTVYADSGVDDQVSCVSGKRFTSINDDFPQMIIHVPFAQNVRVKSIILKLGDWCSFEPGESDLHSHHPYRQR